MVLTRLKTKRPASVSLSVFVLQADLAQLEAPDRGATLLWSKAIASPGVMAWLRLKASLCVNLIQDWRGAIDAATPAGAKTVQLHAHAFMPPWTLFTGLDFAGIAPYLLRRILVHKPKDLNRDRSPRFSTLRGKNGWIRAKTA
jgi:hypothetical protein